MCVRILVLVSIQIKYIVKAAVPHVLPACPSSVQLPRMPALPGTYLGIAMGAGEHPLVHPPKETALGEPAVCCVLQLQLLGLPLCSWGRLGDALLYSNADCARRSANAVRIPSEWHHGGSLGSTAARLAT